ncbi:hypothetical protein KKD03_03450 [Patescibacteria group bacterium]|nr:hypothetical protein [Patescibacteria group bacterium]
MPVILWLVIKVKENKKPRVISYFAGIISSIIFWSILSPIISPKLQSTLIDQFPEIGYIFQELSQEYPNAEFGVSIDYSKTTSFNEGSISSSILRIDIKTDQNLTASNRKSLGEKVCNLLEEHGDSHTNIEISQIKVKKFLIFNLDQSSVEGRTCQEWFDEPPFELPQIPN